MNRIFYLLLFVFTISSCSLFDNDNPDTAFLKIDEVSVKTTTEQGPPTHKITDVWVYADNQLLGTFELPIQIPVILDGESTDFEVFAGFRNNGEKSRSFIYRLMDSKKFTESLVHGQVLEKNLEFEYTDLAIFDFVEDFESNHIFTLDLDEDTNTEVVLTSEEAASGNQSGKIFLSTEHPIINVATIFPYDGMQNSGSDSYLEMEYKNDVPFAVGVVFQRDNTVTFQPIIVLNRKSDWNKIYIDFTLQLTDPDITSYRIYLTTDLEPTNQSEGTIYIDNLKFVHL